MKPFLSFAALAVTALALQALPAKAQTSTSGSNSTSSSGSTSSSTSGSSTTSGTSGNQQRQNTRQNATTNNSTSVPITFNNGAAGGATDPAGANGTNGSNGGGNGGPSGAPFYGQSDITVRTTPTVYAPPVQGGNPCTVGVSGGLSVVGWGAALGGTWVDQDCADRQKIAMIFNAGFKGPAKELMCNDQKTYIAFKTVGEPCATRPQWEQPGQPTPIVQQQPTPIAPQPVQMVTKDRTNLPRCSRTITDNCWGG